MKQFPDLSLLVIRAQFPLAQQQCRLDYDGSEMGRPYFVKWLQNLKVERPVEPQWFGRPPTPEEIAAAEEPEREETEADVAARLAAFKRIREEAFGNGATMAVNAQQP